MGKTLQCDSKNPDCHLTRSGPGCDAHSRLQRPHSLFFFFLILLYQEESAGLNDTLYLQP